MNKYIYTIIILILSFSLTTHTVAYTSTNTGVLPTPFFSQVPPQLTPIVSKLLQLPEARELLARVSQEGEVSIVIQNDPSGQFDALWDGDARQIKVNPYRHPNEGSWICSILFELHNASTNKHMLKLFRNAENNQVSKDAWVEQMERMEHANALNTCRLLEKGMAQNIYPPESTWTIFQSFDDYYKLQQISGHSHWLANYYDQSNPYSNRTIFKGTIPGLSTMTADDKKDLQNYLVIKNNLNAPNQQESLKHLAWVKSEFARLEDCSLGKRQSGCFRTQEKLRLMRIVFNHG